MATLARGVSSRVTFVKPMLATLVAEPFDRSGWLFEIKWDGYRAIAEVDHGKVRLYSRNQKSFAEAYPELLVALKKIKGAVVLDGEMVVVDANNRPSFQLLQKYRRTGQGELRYYVFDLLSYQGIDLRGEPLWKRKLQLRKLVKGVQLLFFSEHVETQGIRYFETASEMGMEGIMAKDVESTYQENTRSKSWLKIKIQQNQEAVIAGFTKPQGARQRFGALVLGVYLKNKLIYVGHTGGGFDRNSLEEVYQQLRPLIHRACPFAVRPKTNSPATWVEPKLVCQVRFQEWTEDGMMRQPIFLGLRTDKAAREVQRELPR